MSRRWCRLDHLGRHGTADSRDQAARMRREVGDADDSFLLTIDSYLVLDTGRYVHAIDWSGTVDVGDRLLLREGDRPPARPRPSAVEDGGFRVSDRSPVLGLRLGCRGGRGRHTAQPADAGRAGCVRILNTAPRSTCPRSPPNRSTGRTTWFGSRRTREFYSSGV